MTIPQKIKWYFNLSSETSNDGLKWGFQNGRMAQLLHPHRNLGHLKSLGDRIKWAMDEARVDRNMVADHFQISYQAVSQWVNDTHKPKSDRLRALAKLLDVNYFWLVEGIGTPDPARDSIFDDEPDAVPVIDLEAAGRWDDETFLIAKNINTKDFLEGRQELAEYIYADIPVSNHSFSIEIGDASMAPEFMPGDKVIIDPPISPKPGDFVVAKLDADSEAVFRKFRPRGMSKGGTKIIELAPINEDYPTLTIDEDNPGRIVGMMVEHHRYWKRTAS